MELETMRSAQDGTDGTLLASIAEAAQGVVGHHHNADVQKAAQCQSMQAVGMESVMRRQPDGRRRTRAALRIFGGSAGRSLRLAESAAGTRRAHAAREQARLVTLTQYKGSTIAKREQTDARRDKGDSRSA